MDTHLTNYSAITYMDDQGQPQRLLVGEADNKLLIRLEGKIVALPLDAVVRLRIAVDSFFQPRKGEWQTRLTEYWKSKSRGPI